MSILSVLGTINQGAKIVTQFKSLSREAQDLFGSFTNGTDMFPASGLDKEGMKRQLKREKQTMDKLQYSDVFVANINRVEPYFDIEKAKEINSMVTSVSIVHDGFETQEDRIGSGYFNWHKGMQSGEVQVTFSEFKDGDVLDFLTKVSSRNAISGLMDDVGVGSAIRGVDATLGKVNSLVNQAGNISKAFGGAGFDTNLGLGEFGAIFGGTGGGVGSGKNGNIMPSDGTCLLPYQYYFNIKIQHIVSDSISNTVYVKTIIDDDYILDGNPSQEYSTGDEKFLEISASFKPIKSWV